ncbi:MAG: nucleoside 2-deoxyribosyltransferase [Defluviitaleaceae bacterium]|nr:nucleoside 2-deoxyribosyltransferase [Defluviitaleaceae bacterium]MCL2273387.1 nucleoside 2-deoxyribosyltransferase [Defluviitaleaceae bacterium]
MIKSADIQECVLELLSDGNPYSVQDIKTHLAEIGMDEYSEGQFAGSMNTLQRNGKIIKTERGIYSLSQTDEEKKNMRTCFVVSPIGNEKSEIRKKADQLFKHIIVPVCKSCGFVAERVDQMNDADSITQKILDRLESADLVIADITGHNPNIFYEMGFRKRTNKPIIHLRKQGENLPFDIAAIRTLDYDLTDLDNVDLIKDKLEKTVKSFSYLPQDEMTEDFKTPAPDSDTPSMLSILYQILDTISDIQDDIKSNNINMLETVIKTLQDRQPQMSTQDAIMAQLLPSMLEKPKMFEQLMKLSDKLPTQQGGKNIRK